MSETVLFVGGPLHGTFRALPEPLPPIYRVPVMLARPLVQVILDVEAVTELPYGYRVYRRERYVRGAGDGFPVYVDEEDAAERGVEAMVSRSPASGWRDGRSAGRSVAWAPSTRLTFRPELGSALVQRHCATWAGTHPQR
jgi:hypothetical protein